MILEICAGTLESAIAAARGGAQRVELCSALGEGGLTPSIGMIKTVREIPGLSLHVLIRPRGGDFVYSASDIECMTEDIHAATACGCDGIVIGALTPDGDIDTGTCRRLIEATGGSGINITFHRAFDLCRDPLGALEQIIDLGGNRILTSGQAATAEQGIPMLKKLHEQAAGRLGILPGSGVTPANAARILKCTGCRELHASARAEVASPMEYRRQGVSMGAPAADEFTRKATSPQTVRELLEQMSTI